MKELQNKVGTSEQDNLIAKLCPPAEAVGIYLAAEAETTYQRGTILALDGDAASPVSGAISAGTPVYVLCDTVTADEAGNIAVAAYRCGSFNRNAVITDGDYELTAADRDVLRTHDIILTDMLDA